MPWLPTCQHLLQITKVRKCNWLTTFADHVDELSWLPGVLEDLNGALMGVVANWSSKNRAAAPLLSPLMSLLSLLMEVP